MNRIDAFNATVTIDDETVIVTVYEGDGDYYHTVFGDRPESTSVDAASGPFHDPYWAMFNALTMIANRSRNMADPDGM